MQQYIDPAEPSLGTYDDEVQPQTATGGNSGASNGGTSSTQSVGTGGGPGTDNPVTGGATPEQRFRAIMKGKPSTPANLKAAEKELNAAGIKVLTNASGVAGKISFDEGGKTVIKDVILGAGNGGQPNAEAWQWLDGSGDDASASTDDWFSANAPPPDPYTTPARPTDLQTPYVPPTWQGGDFAPPTADSLNQDPGYQARLAASQQAFQRSAAAKGTILSGGSQTALGRQQQGIASDEYANAFGRAYDTYKTKYGQFQDSLTASGAARGINENAYQSDVANSLNQYGTRYRTYRDAIDDQFRLADQGLRATSAGAPAQ